MTPVQLMNATLNPTSTGAATADATKYVAQPDSPSERDRRANTLAPAIVDSIETKKPSACPAA